MRKGKFNRKEADFSCFSLLILLFLSWISIPTPVFSSPQQNKNEFTYQVIGVVKSLPTNSGETREILIKHEEIPEYRNRDGEKVGMHSMTMPFYIDSNVALSGIAVGDKVRMTLVQTLEPRFTEKVTVLEKLD